jgi:hypothetical protein
VFVELLSTFPIELSDAKTFRLPEPTDHVRQIIHVIWQELYNRGDLLVIGTI